jgi:hypothetical protein
MSLCPGGEALIETALGKECAGKGTAATDNQFAEEMFFAEALKCQFQGAVHNVAGLGEVPKVGENL